MAYKLIDSSNISIVTGSGGYYLENIFTGQDPIYFSGNSNGRTVHIYFSTKNPVKLSKICIESYKIDNNRCPIYAFSLSVSEDETYTKTKVLYEGTREDVGQGIFTEHEIAYDNNKIEIYKYYDLYLCAAYTSKADYGYSISQIKLYEDNIPKYILKDINNNYYSKINDTGITSLGKEELTEDKLTSDLTNITKENLARITSSYKVIMVKFK